MKQLRTAKWLVVIALLLLSLSSHLLNTYFLGVVSCLLTCGRSSTFASCHRLGLASGLKFRVCAEVCWTLALGWHLVAVLNYCFKIELS